MIERKKEKVNMRRVKNEGKREGKRKVMKEYRKRSRNKEA